MKAINIIWDLDEMTVEERKEVWACLPVEIEIPDDIADDIYAISDFISDETGFCHKGFYVV